MTSVGPTPKELALIEQNLFHAARQVMKKVRPDRWHRDRRAPIAASRVNSSQALAVSVFGTLDSLRDPGRSQVFDALAETMGVPPGGPWDVQYEYAIPTAILGEPTSTQLDVRLTGRATEIAVESKFTEVQGGSCSQTRRPRRDGKGGVLPE